MSKLIKNFKNLAIFVGLLASVVTIYDGVTPPPPATLMLPLVTLQCR